MTGMEEKRRFVRFRAPFCVHFADKDAIQEIPSVVRDISMGGAKIMLDTNEQILSDSLATLHILLPEQTLKLLGRITWVKSHNSRKEIGITFINMPDHYKESIYNTIFRYYKQEITSRWWQF